MPCALDQLARAEAAAPVADAVRLHHYLTLVPDPRGRRGRLYPLVPLLSAAAASVLAGARSLTAIGEWLAHAPRWALRALGFAPDPLTGRIPVPHPGTVRRLLARLDGDALDAAIGSFLTARNTPAARAGLRPIAVDGKTVRGSRTATSPAIALLAAMTHTGDVLARTGAGAPEPKEGSSRPRSRRRGVDGDAAQSQAGHCRTRPSVVVVFPILRDARRTGVPIG
ncbi:transposase family protein [Streptomyces sp. NPDC006476]|uniref:transposase family protein n=1 Tax=Streptomyces sp. NPDC006476 TaxID=3157175 RepID=UPI0033B0ED95